VGVAHWALQLLLWVQSELHPSYYSFFKKKEKRSELETCYDDDDDDSCDLTYFILKFDSCFLFVILEQAGYRHRY
jgi:hypothetical protein